MVEKMKFISITGPKTQIDHVVDTYLSHYEIHLENALSELKTAKDLRPFTETNPYKEEFKRAEALIGALERCSDSSPPAPVPYRLTIEEAVDKIHELDQLISVLDQEKAALLQERAELEESRSQVLPFGGLNYDVSAILHFKHIKYRFGRIAKEYMERFSAFIYDNLDTIMVRCQEFDGYIWIVYFVPEPIADKIDAIYASMHFERFFLPDEYVGTPKEAIQKLDAQIEQKQAAVTRIEEKILSALTVDRALIYAAYDRLKRYTENFDVRKLAATINRDDHTFFILGGWITQQDGLQLKKELEQEKDLFLIIEEEQGTVSSKPPTKLHNFKLLKPFELFIQMYGLPDYHEIDPTLLVALTYSFLFGFMFGDVGQGLCLMLGGFLIYKKRRSNLAAIISCCGFSSMIFGFLFGSVFGFEHVIEALWIHPAAAMVDLPFVGKLNLVFAVTVFLGMGLILFSMVLNIINSLKTKNMERALFDTNGVAGLVFYFSLTAMVLLFMTGHALPGAAVLAVMFVLPLLVMFFKEPLTHLVERKKTAAEGSKVMFIVQGFFELFEVLLSYFSNTLSFVRVGAFAVSHAAMMEVVLMLSGYETGSINWLVVVLGNIFVCGMEGLIVGIQVLRLEYYELFSRFYSGTGRAFKPYKKTIEK